MRSGHCTHLLYKHTNMRHTRIILATALLGGALHASAQNVGEIHGKVLDENFYEIVDVRGSANPPKNILLKGALKMIVFGTVDS